MHVAVNARHRFSLPVYISPSVRRPFLAPAFEFALWRMNFVCMHAAQCLSPVELKSMKMDILWAEISILLFSWLQRIVHAIIFTFLRLKKPFEKVYAGEKCSQTQRGAQRMHCYKSNIWQTFSRHYSIKWRPSQSYQNLPDAVLFVCYS